jgi:antitoxin HicB
MFVQIDLTKLANRVNITITCSSRFEGQSVLYRIPLVFTPQPEGGFTVSSPVLPELITEGDTLEEANNNVRDALAAVVELYADQGRQLPISLNVPATGEIIWSESLVESA